MGAKQTKIEGMYLPETPKIKAATLGTELTQFDHADEIDPRSPNLPRTPIQVLRETTETAVCIEENPHPMGALRRRLLKRFTYNLNDPRSPTAELDRTPLVFDNEKSLNLDDTFANLFIEAKPATSHVVQVVVEPTITEEAAASLPSATINTSMQYNSTLPSSAYSTPMEINELEIEEETMASPAVLHHTPNVFTQQQQIIDPRSPSIGVERTPIILHSSDDEAIEDLMLETVLGTLSAECNDDSLGTPKTKATNKPLESLRVGKVRGNHGKRIRARCQNIYEDRLNLTPKQKSSPLTPQHGSNNSATRRTPLGCVQNRTNLRSRSVEIYSKSLKECLALDSQDDCVQIRK